MRSLLPEDADFIKTVIAKAQEQEFDGEISETQLAEIQRGLSHFSNLWDVA